MTQEERLFEAALEQGKEVINVTPRCVGKSYTQDYIVVMDGRISRANRRADAAFNLGHRVNRRVSGLADRIKAIEESLLPKEEPEYYLLPSGDPDIDAAVSMEVCDGCRAYPSYQRCPFQDEKFDLCPKVREYVFAAYERKATRPEKPDWPECAECDAESPDYDCPPCPVYKAHDEPPAEEPCQHPPDKRYFREGNEDACMMDQAVTVRRGWYCRDCNKMVKPKMAPCQDCSVMEVLGEYNTPSGPVYLCEDCAVACGVADDPREKVTDCPEEDCLEHPHGCEDCTVEKAIPKEGS